MKRTQTVRLKITLRRVAVASGCFLILAISMFVFLNIGIKKDASGATETLASGSFIINMGVTPQTYNNGLKPYGMIYDLIVNYKIPIKWVINPSKARDGIDFTYNSVNYCGGPFIIEASNINSTIAARITYWQGQGIVGVYTTAAISVPVYNTITNFSKVAIDTIASKQSIIIGYYTNAGLPTSAYYLGSPSQLTACVDIWSNPHADPTWATHSYLYNYVTVYKSWLWAECHSVSVLESCKEPVAPFRQLNFLTSNGMQCYSNNKCGTITESHAGSATAPFTYNYPTDPVMQFISDMHQATTNGSEEWYIPPTTGQWNSNTKQLVTSNDGSGQRLGIKMAYGPAYNDTNNGYVMYTGGHDIDGGGTTAQKVSAQRAYFNYVLLAGITKNIRVTATVPSSAYSKDVVDVSAVGSSGTTPYTFKWTSQLGAAFINSTSANAKYNVPNNSTAQTDIITVTITDNCNRVNFVAKPIAIQTTLPIKLKSFNAYPASNGTVKVDWTTASEVNNDNFTIQRSIDGDNFADIGKVRGAGNSTVLLDYSFTDEHPSNGISYYRLRQTDFDGHTETFNIISVNLNEKLNDINSIHIYPNPFNDSFTAEFESVDKKDVQVQILSVNGTIVFSEPITIEEGKNSYRFTSSENIKTGIYIFRIMNNSSILANSRIYCRKN